MKLQVGLNYGPPRCADPYGTARVGGWEGQGEM